MNSLWHLISPSLLIWLSAGICTAIHSAGASRLAPQTQSDALPKTDLQPNTQGMLIAHEFYSLPELLGKNMRVIHHGKSQRSAQVWLFYIAGFHRFSNFAFILLRLIDT